MWLHKFFKPAKKVGSDTEACKALELSLTPQQSLANKLLAFSANEAVDEMFRDAVVRRFLLTLHWPDIQSLFDAVINSKKTSGSLTAVNIYTYFKSAGTPPSVCLQRLSVVFSQTERLPYGVLEDCEHLLIQLQEALTIYNSDSIKDQAS